MGGKGSGRRLKDDKRDYIRLPGPRGRPRKIISPGTFVGRLMEWGLSDDSAFYVAARLYLQIKKMGSGELRVRGGKSGLFVHAWSEDMDALVACVRVDIRENAPGPFLRMLMKSGLLVDPHFYKFAQYCHYFKVVGVGESVVSMTEGAVKIVNWAKACPHPPPRAKACPAPEPDGD